MPTFVYKPTKAREEKLTVNRNIKNVPQFGGKRETSEAL